MASPIELLMHSSSAEATDALAFQLGQRLHAGSVLCIDGELGAGKTLFVKGLARGLGIDEPVDSPTFTLMNQYEGRLTLYHLDAWMQGRERAFLEGGGEECLHGGGVTAIEWGGRVLDLLPRPLVWIELEHRSPEERQIRMRVVSAAEGAGSEEEEHLEAAIAGLEPSSIHEQLACLSRTQDP